ncbi:MAG: hypothetical protein ACRDBM_14475 [Sporomusa sp.]
MADCKQNINKHLNSAQQWLSEAEQAFDKDSDIRGELNLFLAQAELTHAKEVSRSRYWRHRYPVLRHSLAIALAVAITTGGMAAGYLWTISRPNNSEPLSVEQSIAMPAKSPLQPNSLNEQTVPTALPATADPESSVNETIDSKGGQPADVKQTSAQPAPVERSRSASAAEPSKARPLTAEEINQLTRLAGKSLRGL